MSTITQSTLVGFDTETTGVDIFNDRIVTASIVVRSPGAEDEVRAWLLNPNAEISEAASRVNGITNEHARARGMDAATGLSEIADVLAAHIQAGNPIVAFNAVFDLSILESELRRYGLPALHERTSAPLRVLDPSVLDRALSHRKGSRKLVDVCAFYGIEVDADSLHDATADVQATLNVLGAILALHPDREDFADYRNIMTFQKMGHHKWITQLKGFYASRGKDTSSMSPPVAGAIRMSGATIMDTSSRIIATFIRKCEDNATGAPKAGALSRRKKILGLMASVAKDMAFATAGALPYLDIAEASDKGGPAVWVRADGLRLIRLPEPGTQTGARWVADESPHCDPTFYRLPPAGWYRPLGEHEHYSDDDVHALSDRLLKAHSDLVSSRGLFSHIAHASLMAVHALEDARREHSL